MKDWWQSDTAKAVSTIIAVLLIPAAVLAWNYASNESLNSQEEILEGANTENTEMALDEDGNEVPSENSTMNEEENNNGEQAMNQDNENTTTEGNTESTTNSDSENTTQNNEVGGINQVTELPNTSAKVEYTTKEGDNIYNISLSICGDESFYAKNRNKDFIMVGQMISVECN